MSIIKGPIAPRAEDEDDTNIHLADEHFTYEPLARSGGCFYCGNPFEGYPVVQWHGWGSDSTTDIFLHPDCARDLGSHLISDWGWVKSGRWRA